MPFPLAGEGGAKRRKKGPRGMSLHGQRPGNGREPLQEIFERIPAFEILEERLDRHARPSEHGQAVHGFRVYEDRV